MVGTALGGVGGFDGVGEVEVDAGVWAGGVLGVTSIAGAKGAYTEKNNFNIQILTNILIYNYSPAIIYNSPHIKNSLNP